jgi:hypothetical protein
MTSRPSDSEFAPYYLRYVSLAHESDALSALGVQAVDLTRVMASVPPERETFRYAPGKWSVREVLGHLIDDERVLGTRAFCISRGELASLPSFDENQYVAASDYNARPLAELLEEFTLIRTSNLLFLRRLTQEGWTRMGTTSDKPVSVRALAFIMVGHVRHHLNVLRTAYGVSAAV